MRRRFASEGQRYSATAIQPRNQKRRLKIWGGVFLLRHGSALGKPASAHLADSGGHRSQLIAANFAQKKSPAGKGGALQRVCGWAARRDPSYQIDW